VKWCWPCPLAWPPCFDSAVLLIAGNVKDDRTGSLQRETPDEVSQLARKLAERAVVHLRSGCFDSCCVSRGEEVHGFKEGQRIVRARADLAPRRAV